MPPLRVQPFRSLTYERPDLEQIADSFRRARLRMRLAMKPESAIHAVEEAQTVSLDYHSAATLADIRCNLRIDDAQARDEQVFFQQSKAEVDLMEQAFFQAMTASRFRDALNEHFGERVFTIAAQLHEIVQVSVTRELIEEQQLIRRYNQLLSDAIVYPDNQSMSLAEMNQLLTSSDRSTRQIAWQARADWYTAHKSDIDQIFDDLLSLRTKLSRKLGFNSFLPVAARRLQRSGYGWDELAEMRDLIRTYIVPLTREIRRLQRRRLGLDHLSAWDMKVLFADGDTRPDQTYEDLPAAVAGLVGDLTGQHPSLLSSLLEAGYVDWQARPGKTGNASCRMLYEAGVPFIQVNGCSSAQDVFTLLHETGHAYAAWRSLSTMTMRRTHLPTPDSAEIHAMALEVLSYPYLERLFGRGAETVALTHMTRALLRLPADCMADEFQHRVYTEPDLTAAQRDQIWQELMAAYQPDQFAASADHPELCQPWQLEAQIFNRPFEHISRVTGQMAALDIWQISRLDLSQALARYDQLCALGGQVDLPDLLQQTGLQSPFERDTIKRLVYQVCDFLSL